MRKTVIIALFTSAVLANSPAAAQSERAVALLQDYALYNQRCRGGSGDDIHTWEACGARNYIGFLLSIEGWCFGKEGEASYQMKWHRCTKQSDKFSKPDT